MKELTLLSNNEKKMINLGKYLTKISKKNFYFYLHRDLGVRKTTLCRGFLQGLGYKEYVKSPTYTLIESYFIKPNFIYHFDLYRLTNPKKLEFIGIRDYFNKKIYV